MLRELVSALAFPAGRQARRMGHVGESVAIEARWRRCRAAWEPHLDRCRKAILGAARQGGNVAVVLGSGPLLDVPLEGLAERFAQVWLIDAAHPRRSRRQAARFANVHLLEWDLLGLRSAADMAGAAERLGLWRARVPPADLVVSVNLLTQLALKPLDKWPQADPAGWSRGVMAAHLADLAQGPGQALLISEFHRRRLDRRDHQLGAERPLEGLALPSPVAHWEWELAPFGEISADWRTVLDVGAYRWRRTGG